MAAQRFVIEPARQADIGEIAAVLRGAKLPAEAIREHLADFLVARDGSTVVGCVALERYQDTGILRSLAVTPVVQGRGVGMRLAEAIIEHARAAGIQTMVLLTETARDFFADKLGFEVVERSTVSAAARASWQFTGAVCQSATCMRLELQQ